jgi:hypothetical protein
MALQGGRASQAAEVPSDDAAATPNPPPTRTGDVHPEELLQQNAEAMAPTPP